MTEWISLIVGAAGLVLSLWNTYSIFRKGKRQVKVTATPMIDNGAGMRVPGFHLEVVNVGIRPVTIASLVFETSSGEKIEPIRGFGKGHTILKKELTDGDLAYWDISNIDIEGYCLQRGISTTFTLRPVATDSVGTRHLGAAVSINPHDL